MRPKAWSYSALSSFELCPRKHWAEKVGRTKKEVVNAKAEYGSIAHKAFENRVMKGKKLPLDLVVYEPILAALAAPKKKKHIEVLPEQKMALNEALCPVGWYDNDVWVRGIADYVMIDTNARHALVVDYKFGRRPDSDDQLLLSAFMVMMHTDTTAVKSSYFLAESRALTNPVIVGNDEALDAVPGMVHPSKVLELFTPRVKKYQAAFDKDEWPATPNFLCRKHCPVKECQHNGG